MALTIGSGGGVGILYGNTTKTPFTSLPHRPVHPQFTIPLSGRTLHIVSAKKFSPRTGRLDNKNRRGGITTKEQEVEQRTAEIEDGNNIENVVLVDGAGEGYMLPELPGDKPDFWEGSKWDAFGFFVQYLWAFGIVFAFWESDVDETPDLVFSNAFRKVKTKDISRKSNCLWNCRGNIQ
ncbi:AT-rich interactive domain protein [Quillaja saponaria]|uniref:AT-rich interactive domain protein n=1 Tax=Quillaja saponaria TaxID=32244 RepID=A0AAD7PVF1_QUISA|nr:AT-rich interactive domain protein [Quillaja saponaria]